MTQLQTELVLDSLSKASSAKGAVIQVLSGNWPLSAKQVHSKVLREHAINVSYQAIHKCLNDLLLERVVIKEGLGYKLNLDWVKQLKKFADALNKKYSPDKESRAEIDPKAQSIKLHFDDFSVMCVTLAEIIESKVLTGTGPEMIIGCVRHLHFPLSFKFQDFELLYRLINVRKLRAVGVVKCDTPWSRWIADKYIMAGTIDEIFCPELEIEDDIYIDGDSIIHVKMSDGTKKLLDEVYGKVTGLTSLMVEDFKNKYSKWPVSIDIEIIRNKELANMLRQNLAKRFNFEHILKQGEAEKK